MTSLTNRRFVGDVNKERKKQVTDITEGDVRKRKKFCKPNQRLDKPA